MLRLKLFTFKRFFEKDGGDVVLDITRRSISFDRNPRPRSSVIVSAETEMRMDLIAYSAYKEQGNMDFLLKYNNISNPFSLEKGRVILLPTRQDLRDAYYTPDEIVDRSLEKPNNQSQFVVPKTEKDKKRLEQLKKKAKTREILPPNINKTGDKNIKVKDGKIIFGDDVTTVNKEDCPEPISRARLKERLTLNKIFQ